MPNTKTTETTTTETAAPAMHPFERAGLGKAPFRVVGFAVHKYQACQGAPVQCGTSCDFCGQGIMNAAQVKSADGKTFKVGCDCVRRAGDATLTKRVDDLVRKHERGVRQARATKRKAGLAELLTDESVRATLGSLPHPWQKHSDASLLTYAEHTLTNPHAGDKARTKLQKMITAALAG
jgi:hypothetical protein